MRTKHVNRYDCFEFHYFINLQFMFSESIPCRNLSRFYLGDESEGGKISNKIQSILSLDGSLAWFTTMLVRMML